MAILILGGSGMLGHKLFQVLRERFADVSCTLRATRESSRLQTLPLFAGDDVIWNVDAFDWPALKRLLRSLEPGVILNAIGVIKQRRLAADAVASIQINALLPHQLARLASEWGGRVIHFSTDCVFNGQKGGYRETDLPDAADLYGRTKSLGEIVEVSNALTLRSSIIGRELGHHQSLLDWFLSQDGGDVQGYERVTYSGVTTVEMAEVVAMLLRDHGNLSGLFHVAASSISKHELLGLIAEAFRMNVRLRPVAVPVTDLSLNADRFHSATGYTAPDWRHLVSALADDPTPYTEWLRLLADD